MLKNQLEGMFQGNLLPHGLAQSSGQRRMLLDLDALSLSPGPISNI